MGSGPAEVVPVRLDPELRAAVEARATADDTTTSEIIREALRRFLHPMCSETIEEMRLRRAIC